MPWKKKLSMLLLSFFTFIICGVSQQDTMTLSIVEVPGPGGICGDTTDCANNQICFNLVGVPSSGIVGYQVANYDIWLSTTGGVAVSATLPIISETSCIAFNTTDLIGNAGNIRVGANDVGGDPGDFIAGQNVIHNFCISYNNLLELQAINTGASPGLPGGSAMAANLSGNPGTTLDIFLTEAVLILNENTVTCIPPTDTLSIIVPVNSTSTVCVDTTGLPGNLSDLSSCGEPISGGTLSNPNSVTACIDYTAPGLPDVSDAFCVLACDDTDICNAFIVMVTTCVTLPADAGLDQEISIDSTTVSGNDPGENSGEWTLINGSGVITDPNSATTSLTGLGAGINVFSWTITGSCTPASDSDTIQIMVGGCPDCLSISGILPSDVFQANISISSDAFIDLPETVLFRAGNIICLDPNFEVVLGAEFDALIGPCVNP